MVENVILTDARRDALSDYNPDDANHRGHKSKTKQRAEVAFDELIEVAASPVVENPDVFPPEKVRHLLVYLLAGSGGLVGDDVDTGIRAWSPSPEYRNALYGEITRAQLAFEVGAEPGELYEILGERAKQVRREQPSTEGSNNE